MFGFASRAIQGLQWLFLGLCVKEAREVCSVGSHKQKNSRRENVARTTSGSCAANTVDPGVCLTKRAELLSLQDRAQRCW